MAYAGQGYVQPAYAGQAYAQPAYADQSYAVQENVQETIPQGMTYGKSASSGLAVASLVFGIVALLTSFIIVLGLINALLAVSFGIAGLVSCKKNQKSGKGLAIAGLIMGGIALIIAIVLTVINLLVDISFVLIDPRLKTTIISGGQKKAPKKAAA